MAGAYAAHSVRMRWLVPAVFIVAAAAFGAAIPMTPPWWIPLAVVAGLVVMVSTAIFPMIGLVATFLLTVQVVPPQFAPEVSLKVVKLDPGEILFMWTFFVCAARAVLLKQSDKFEWPRFSIPVLFILGCAFVGVVYGKYIQHNGEFVLAEARGFLGLLALPMIQFLIRDRNDIRQLCMWLCFAAVIVAGYIIVQTVTGIPILGGRFEPLDHENADVMRSVAPGASVQAFALYYMALSLKSPGGRIRFWLLPLILIVLLGLLGTFGRGTWVTTALGGLIVAFLIGKWRGLFLAMLAGVLLVTLTLSAAYVVKPRVAEAAIDRALGIGRELDKGDSFGWRRIENQLAIKSILKRPWLGTGLGGIYKDVASSRGHFDAEFYFIHNSYLFFPLKMGIFAALGPILIIGTFLLLFLRIYRMTNGQVGTIVAICTGLTVVMHIAAYAGQTLRSFPGLLPLCTAMGLCACMYRFLRAEQKASPQVEVIPRAVPRGPARVRETRIVSPTRPALPAFARPKEA